MEDKQDKDLFDQPMPKPPKSLVLQPTEKQKLSKPQQAFNRLVKKVEQLRKGLKEQAGQLQQAMIEYASKVVPVEDELNKRHTRLITLLAPYLSNNQINAKDQKVLREVIANQIDLIQFRMGEIPDEIQPVYEIIHGVSTQQAEQAEWDESRQKFQDLIDELGLKNIDLSRLKPGLSPEETAAETMRVMMQIQAETQRIGSQDQAQGQRRKKSKSKLKKEELARQAEEARKRSISKIYRELARALHPDLEPNESLKPRKTELMQKLTEAYRSNDLHTILQLELEWITGESDNLQRLTEEKLAIYNKMLQEQAKDLQEQLYLQLMHPNYRLIVRSHPIFDELFIIDCNIMKQDYEETMDAINFSIHELENGNAVREVRSTVKTYRDHMRQSKKMRFEF